jgi:hypothetical protein
MGPLKTYPSGLVACCGLRPTPDARARPPTDATSRATQMRRLPARAGRHRGPRPESYEPNTSRRSSIPLADIEEDPGAVPLDKAQWIITYCT